MSEKLIIGASNCLGRDTAKIELYKMVLNNVQVFPVLGRQRHMRQHLQFVRAIVQVAHIQYRHKNTGVTGLPRILTIGKKHKAVVTARIERGGQFLNTDKMGHNPVRHGQFNNLLPHYVARQLVVGNHQMSRPCIG